MSSIFAAFGLSTETHLTLPVGVYSPQTTSDWAYFGNFFVIRFVCFITLPPLVNRPFPNEEHTTDYGKYNRKRGVGNKSQSNSGSAQFFSTNSTRLPAGCRELRGFAERTVLTSLRETSDYRGTSRSTQKRRISTHIYMSRVTHMYASSKHLQVHFSINNRCVRCINLTAASHVIFRNSIRSGTEKMPTLTYSFDPRARILRWIRAARVNLRVLVLWASRLEQRSFLNAINYSSGMSVIFFAFGLVTDTHFVLPVGSYMPQTL